MDAGFTSKIRRLTLRHQNSRLAPYAEVSESKLLRKKLCIVRQAVAYCKPINIRYRKGTDGRTVYELAVNFGPLAWCLVRVRAATI